MTSKWALLLVGLLVGCGPTRPNTDPPSTVEVTKYVYYDCGAPPKLDPLELTEVIWKVVPVNGVQVIALDAAQYENLSRNDAAILSRAQQLAAQRDFYAQCIERSKLVQPKVVSPAS